MRTQKEICENMKKNKEGDEKTIAAIANQWLRQIELYDKYSTYIKYKGIYINHIKDCIGDKKIYQITNEDCLAFIEEKCMCKSRRLSKNTITGIKSVLFQILKYGNSVVSYELINSQLSIKRLKDYNKIAVLTPDEQFKLQSYLLKDIDNYKLGVVLCLYTGIRLGEICALKNEDICLADKKVYIRSTVQRITSGKEDSKTELYISSPKTMSSAREIPLCDFLITLLQDKISDDLYLVNKKTPMEPRTYQYKFKRYLADAAIHSNYHFHTLRHTFATNCISSGMDPKCLSEILGHSDVKTTLNRYVHPSFETKIQQINAYASLFDSVS